MDTRKRAKTHYQMAGIAVEHCGIKYCKSGLKGTVPTHEVIGDGCWRTLICTRCAEILDLKPEAYLPTGSAAEKANKKLKKVYKEKLNG